MADRYVVPDTCAVAAALFNEVYSANALPLIEAIHRQGVHAIAPVLGIAEFLNVSRKKVEARDGHSLHLADVEAIVADFFSLPIAWENIEQNQKKAWRWYHSGVETADAFFLQTAIDWDAEIWTTDQKFFNAARPHYSKLFNLQTSVFA